MKKVLLAAIGLMTVSVVPALAADLPARTYTKAPPPVAPIYNWGGFYVGLNAGGASSHNCWDITSVGVGVAPAREGCHNATGGVAGGQVGYRWQLTNWVFGLEAQGDWADLSGSNQSTGLLGRAPFTNRTKVDAIGLFTGQIGYAWNNVLWYAKGGAAVTDNKFSGIQNGNQFDAASNTRWGGAVGTGVEIGFAPNWSVAVEYDHLFMGNTNVTFAATPLATLRSDNIHQDVDMGSVRVNYTFGGPILARY